MNAYAYPWSVQVAGTSNYIAEVSITTWPVGSAYSALPKGIVSVTLEKPGSAETTTLRAPIGQQPGDSLVSVRGPQGTALAQMVTYLVNGTMVWQFVFNPIGGLGPNTILRVPYNAPAPPASLAPVPPNVYAVQLTVTVASQQSDKYPMSLTITLPLADLRQNAAATTRWVPPEFFLVFLLLVIMAALVALVYVPRVLYSSIFGVPRPAQAFTIT